MSDHFHTAPVARHQGRLVSRQGRIVERVFTPRIRPWIALVAINRPGCICEKSSILISAAQKTQGSINKFAWMSFPLILERLHSEPTQTVSTRYVIAHAFENRYANNRWIGIQGWMESLFISEANSNRDWRTVKLPVQSIRSIMEIHDLETPPCANWFGACSDLLLKQSNENENWNLGIVSKLFSLV